MDASSPICPLVQHFLIVVLGLCRMKRIGSYVVSRFLSLLAWYHAFIANFGDVKHISFFIAEGNVYVMLSICGKWLWKSSRPRGITI